MTEGDRVPRQTDSAPVDSELGTRVILFSTIGLVVITLAAVVLMWGFTVYLLDSFAAEDPPPPPLPEAREPYLPPEPRLQTTPFTDLSELRAEEERLLSSYGWVNERGGTARVPIDRAMELLIERGSAGPLRVLQPGTQALANSPGGSDK